MRYQSIHEPHLTDPEKLAYLRQSLKNGPVRHVIEGLSGSGNDYAEAVECLQKRYDKPRLLDQAHVRAIIEAPGPKEGNGKELLRLHDVCSQHLRALKAKGYFSPRPFITKLVRHEAGKDIKCWHSGKGIHKTFTHDEGLITWRFWNLSI